VGLLSVAEKLGLCLSKIEILDLLSKEKELGILLTIIDPNTTGALLNLTITLLIVGPLCSYFVLDDSSWEVTLQVVVALLSIVSGLTAFAKPNLVSKL